MSSLVKGAAFFAKSAPVDGPPVAQWIFIFDTDEGVTPSNFCGLVVTPSNAWLMSWDNKAFQPHRVLFDEYSTVAVFDEKDLKDLSQCSPPEAKLADQVSALEAIWAAGVCDLGWRQPEGMGIIRSILFEAEATYLRYYRKSYLSVRPLAPALGRHIGLTTLRVWKFSPAGMPTEGISVLLRLIDQLLVDRRLPLSLPEDCAPVAVRRTSAGEQVIDLTWPGVLKTIKVPCSSITPWDLVLLNMDIQRVVHAWQSRLTLASLRY